MKSESRTAHVRTRLWRLVALGLATIGLQSSVFAAVPTPSALEPALPGFKMFIESSGAYRLGFEDLVAAGLEVTGPDRKSGLPSAGLGLTSGGQAVPVWLEDGEDGFFGPGDWIEFVGEHLAGEYSYASEHSRYNVYFLRFDHYQPRRIVAAEESIAGEPSASVAYRRLQHLEDDALILRLPPAATGEPEELWFWAKMAHNTREPFSVDLDLADLAVESDGTVDLRVHFRGWSKPRTKPDAETPDHQVDMTLNGASLTSAQWNGTSPHLVEIPAIPVSELISGDNTLVLKVPIRPDGKERHLIDVVMLNWIEVVYPRHDRVGTGQAVFTVDAATEPPAIQLARDPEREILVYGEQGTRFAIAPGPPGTSAFVPAPGEQTFTAVASTELSTPDAIVFDRPTRLTESDQQADYLMVAHHSLIDAIGPLAELHRSRGLSVEVIDIADVYDEFNHGVSHPRALRAFLAHAHQHWQKPTPKFVLLVGDASWDARNEVTIDANYADWTYRPGESKHFGKNQSTPYSEDAELNHRHLVPTWSHATGQGHSASDNYFVAVDGEDRLPDLAIGRLPVVTPDEVADIVEKTMRYVSEPEVGPWRRNALLITNESRGFQRRSDQLASRLTTAGFSSDKVYPASTETSNELHTRKLLETFDEGQLFVHFLGHGGRYIWRTGPPDLEKNHDLLTLDHLEQLEETRRLPVVLSMTCYSAPFDHPSADSIGEKLLRIADRGAVGVVAASWRNSPSPAWGAALLDELMTPGATIGEAVQRAKRDVGHPMFVETYNLLGDPAVPVALPAGQIDLVAVPAEGEDRPIRVTGRIDLEAFDGSVILDLVDPAGSIVHTVSAEAEASVFDLVLEVGPADLAADPAADRSLVLRAYAWNTGRGIDAVGALVLETGVTALAQGVLVQDREALAQDLEVLVQDSEALVQDSKALVQDSDGTPQGPSASDATLGGVSR